MGLVICVFVFGLLHGNFLSFFLSGIGIGIGIAIAIAIAVVMEKKERRGMEEGGCEIRRLRVAMMVFFWRDGR